MAAHSSVLAWRISGTGEPGGLSSMGSHRVGHDWSDLAAAAAANHIVFSSVQFSRSVVSDSLWLMNHSWMRSWITAHQASLFTTNSQSSPKLMSIESVMPSSHLILCCPLLLLPPIPPSIRVFSNESTLHMRWPKYWSFSFSIIHSKGIPGLISFRMDWLNLLAVQRTLKSLLQHRSSKASILRCSAFFTVLVNCKFTPFF